MRRSLHPTARKGRETKWEMMRLWGKESRKLKAEGRKEVKHCQATLKPCCSDAFSERITNTNTVKIFVIAEPKKHADTSKNHYYIITDGTIFL